MELHANQGKLDIRIFVCHILVKFPDNKYHTAKISRFVSIPINGQVLDTIWYIDITERHTEDEEIIGSFSVIRDNKDGTLKVECSFSEILFSLKLYESNLKFFMSPFDIDTK